MLPTDLQAGKLHVVLLILLAVWYAAMPHPALAGTFRAAERVLKGRRQVHVAGYPNSRYSCTKSVIPIVGISCWSAGLCSHAKVAKHHNSVRQWCLCCRYFDPETVGLDFNGMKEDLQSAPEGSVVVLHGALLA